MSTSTSQPQPHSLIIPSVSWDHIHSFHETHFSPLAKQVFLQFIQPQPSTTDSSDLQPQQHQYQDGYNNQGDEIEEYNYGEGEGKNEIIWGQEEGGGEDLGYYHDGVKRTLTDAQIAIFRHSEIQEMLKIKRKQLASTPTIANEASSIEVTLQDSTNKPNSITEDYSTHDPRSRPILLTKPVESSALPWDDEDVGAWVEGNQHQQQKYIGDEEEIGVKGVNKTNDKGVDTQRKPLAVKATYDAPSGKQFFWPVIEK